MLQVVPVIDLLDGQVVHARRGERARYQPVRSRLCDGSAPLEVVAALLEVHAFPALYVADLSAIQGLGEHRAVLCALRAAHPALQLWVDAGIATATTLRAWNEADLGIPIIGAESLSDLRELRAIIDAAAGRPWILSMDFRGVEFLGPAGLLDNTALWPSRVLAMNLAKVGSGEGPDVALIARLAQAAAHSAVYAAGGIRGIDDLDLAAQAGARGALVATALHDGRIEGAQLTQYFAAAD